MHWIRTSQPAKQEVIIVMRLQDILHGSSELEKEITDFIFCLCIMKLKTIAYDQRQLKS